MKLNCRMVFKAINDKKIIQESLKGPNLCRILKEYNDTIECEKPEDKVPCYKVWFDDSRLMEFLEGEDVKKYKSIIIFNLIRNGLITK